MRAASVITCTSPPSPEASSASRLVAEGRKSGADLVAMLSTKAVLSEAQRKQLLDLDNPPAADPEPALTPEQSDFVGQMEGSEQ